MWIFPSGYCFALQAGSIGNDLVGATLFLASISFALNARTSHQWGDFALAAIGMALATGVKPSNAPLALPWLLAVWLAIPLLWQKAVRGIALALVSVMVSFAPNAFLNHRICGDWTGMAVEPVMMKAGSPGLCLSWNIPYLLLQNLTPPVFPVSAAYNRQIEKMIPDDLKSKLAQHFQPEAAGLQAYELMMEEQGSLGLGIVALLLIGSTGGLLNSRKSGSELRANPTRTRLFCAFSPHDHLSRFIHVYIVMTPPIPKQTLRSIRFRNRLIAIFPWLSSISEIRNLLAASSRWRREGWFLPVPHSIRRAMLLSHARAIGAEIFVETGTYKGGTIWCLLGEFKEMHTIEVVPELAALARERFRKRPEVNVIEGDSAMILPDLCAKLDAPCLFYLDGHYSGGITGGGDKDCPVIMELEAIFTNTRVPFRIVIDDARLFGEDPTYPDTEFIREFVRTRDPEMNVQVENDAILIYAD